MNIERDTIKCESIFNQERTHRFLWKRVWNKDKPLTAVIMLNPCQSDNIITDTTTSLVVNGIARLEDAGGVEILNLYSKLTTKLNFRWNSNEELNLAENDSYIEKSCEECSRIILAWGRGAETNQRVTGRIKEIWEILKKYEDKLYCISDGTRNNLHPLTPSTRKQWILEPFDSSFIKENMESR